MAGVSEQALTIKQPPQPLGDTSARVLKYLRAYVAKHDYAPLLSEIATALDLASSSVARYHLAQLERHGLVSRGPRGAVRGLSLIDDVSA